MKNHLIPANYFRGFGFAFLLLFVGVACLPVLTTPESTPIPQTVMPTQVLTSAGSPLPEVPPTGTPQPAAASTPTPTPFLFAPVMELPSLTPTSPPPHITILDHSLCMFGPGTDYLLKYGLFALNWMRVVGRNPDGTWLNIKAQNDPLSNACWIQTDQVRFDSGSLQDVPIVSMVYPYSVLYQPPTLVSATRTGDVVTISWQPVYMTEDDARGYLVEAWVCQGGRQVFVPVGRVVSFAQNNNTDTLSLQVTDESGCDIASNARLYAVEKHGYTPYREISWPGLEAANTVLETPVPAGTPPAASGLPLVSLPQYTDCLYGPGAFFLYKTSLPAGSWIEVAGRSPDGAWLAVQELNGWDPCWIPLAQARFAPGSLDAVPVTFPTLPHSFWYKPPAAVAHRAGTEVKVSWKAIGMAEYDYHGYLIIAWVCQGGRPVYLPVNVMPPYAENTGTLSVTIQDEPGCRPASSARIYTAEKRGYSGEKVFWPAP
jgi:hypothetical protein